MINVSPLDGQADAHLIQFPNGQTVMIDVGEGYDAPPGTLLAFLSSNHIRHLDLVLISHCHKDHYGRLADMIRAGIRVDRVAINVPDPALIGTEDGWGYDWPDVKRLLEFLRSRGIPYFTPKAGDYLIRLHPRLGRSISLQVVAVYDGLHTPIGKTDVNDTSYIVRLTDGRTRVLFTGDLNNALGRYLAHSRLDLAADILKVSHHGTEGNAPNEFFDRVHPRIALVPSPKRLFWSLRSKRIRTYFSDRRIPTYVNGIHGDVTVIFDGKGFRVETERHLPALFLTATAPGSN